MHVFDPWTKMKWQYVNFYRKPGLGYQKLAQYRHKDIFDREWTGDYDDRYISAWDGRVSKLVVQAVDEIYDNNVTSTYRRTFIRNISPLFIRLANWPFNHVDYSVTGKPTSEGKSCCSSHKLSLTRTDYPMLCLKWFLASCAITLVVHIRYHLFTLPALTLSSDF
jgi:hypothetical protein